MLMNLFALLDFEFALLAITIAPFSLPLFSVLPPVKEKPTPN